MPDSNDQLLELDFRTFQELGNGLVAQQIQRLIEKAAEDMQNRCSDKRARKVRLTLEMKPKTRIEDDLLTGKPTIIIYGCSLRVGFNLLNPDYKSRDYDCGFNDAGKIVFNPHSPDDHRQKAFPTIVEEGTFLRMRPGEVDGRTAAAGS